MCTKFGYCCAYSWQYALFVNILRDFIHDTIINEMLHDNFKKETREKFLSIIDDLQTKGAEGIVLGCTEIPLLIKQEDVKLPLLNTLEIHAAAVVDYALS